MSNAILYSFRRCPFAMRARWALLHSGVKVLLREVDLKHKPKELYEVSPKATVPVLITERGEIIDESIDIMKWAINKSSNLIEMRDKDVNDSILINNLINENDNILKNHIDRFKYSNKFPLDNPEIHKYLAREILHKWNSMIKGNSHLDNMGYIIRSTESLCDWALWPFVRQYIKSDVNIFNEEKSLHHLQSWLNYFVSNPSFKLLMIKRNAWSNSHKDINYPY